MGGFETRPYKREKPFVGATHGSPWIRRRMLKEGEAMPRPYEVTALARAGSVGAGLKPAGFP
jgi:acyl-coenzyme A synthetase/AMP-(fatty) acid ligase